MDNNELIHWGVKGMKWGVRRYQNKDGSLTPAGKKRYDRDYEGQARMMSDAELRSQINRMNLEKRYMDLSRTQKTGASKVLDTTDKAASVGSNVNTLRTNAHTFSKHKDPWMGTKGEITGNSLNVVSKSAKVANKIDNIVTEGRDAKRSRKQLSSMTDQDLRNTVNRMNMERQYADLKRDTVERGRVNVNKILEVTGDVVQIGASAVMIAVGIRKLMT